MRITQWLTTLVMVTGFGAGAVWMLLPGEADRLREANERLERERFELQRAIQRLTGEDRVAEVHVIDQVLAGQIVDGKVVERDATTIEFIEIDRQGHPLPSKRFVIPDRIVHFDALVIKFEQEDVAAGDSLRGKSLALFRRIYGENQTPAEGFRLDPENDVPDVYRVNPDPSPFERQLWSRFWEYARNPDLAARDRVRVAQGESVYEPMMKGDVWTLTLQNNGGLNIKFRRTDRSGPSRNNAAAPIVN
ncbi:MAG TPA: hypothetical protein PL151_04155 [Phycisphaerae bacterium]|nr:hypothetical protein [Phycisphaerae bacterium]HOJ75234.1 hypothetical protein [Phycisphaerae bacterium]HOM52415.1 hypothetical protein [Phycisphaerae bacterium]HON68624.1 hypothetical protein [Phycisphaerae bacterium]HPP27689.1 hypothetical protein [Phycisphaerae bacterium]